MGWHLRALLLCERAVDVVAANRSTFSDPHKLSEFCGAVDAIVHLAGVNRGDDSVVHETNVALADQLLAACTATGAKPHIVFANSTHRARPSAYGTSKRIAGEKFAVWAQNTGATFTNLVLPHVFGERCRPFYNSAVATFCHQLANHETPTVIVDGELELIHAQRVAEQIQIVIDSAAGGDVRVDGSEIRVSEVLAKLRYMSEQYGQQLIPELASALDLDLFNSYRGYLYPQSFPVNLAVRSDARGGLFEAVKTLHGGQCFISTTQPGITRGNHFHRRKLERFLVLQGEALIRVRRLNSSDVCEFKVSGRTPQYIDIPTLHTHNITNVGTGELTTLFWAQEIFDAAHPDTYPERV